MESTARQVRVDVLGPVRLTIGGRPVHLPPYTRRLLLRLVAAEGEAVSVRTLRRDVWGLAAEPRHLAQRGRNEVQKRVFELRRALETAGSGVGARILRTDQVPTARGPETTYRLLLETGELDCAEFAAWVNGALRAAPAEAARKLTEALALFRGAPLADAAAEEFAEPLAQRLLALRESARRELIRCHLELGRSDLALPLAERTAVEHPHDTATADLLGELRIRLRRERGGDLLRYRLPDLPVEIAVVRGDLFDQTDANLVVGFTDTFDTHTGRDSVISLQSVQGQLVDRLFGGSTRELDGRLRPGLRSVAPVGTESVRDKPRGKRVRYPIGTVVPVPLDGGRRVFATAYSFLGNDLVARSGLAELHLALDRLWPSVARYGLHKPVAVPLLGAGLARIVELRKDQLITMIIDTFLEHCRREPRTAPELRLVLHPDDLSLIDLGTVEKHLFALAPDRGR